jgi:hypothetical protein
MAILSYLFREIEGLENVEIMSIIRDGQVGGMKKEVFQFNVQEVYRS